MNRYYFPCDECGAALSSTGICYRCDYCHDQTFCQSCADQKVIRIPVCRDCHQHFELCAWRKTKMMFLCTKCSSPSRPSSKDLMTFLLKKAGFDSLNQAERACLNDLGIPSTHITVSYDQTGQVNFRQ